MWSSAIVITEDKGFFVPEPEGYPRLDGASHRPPSAARPVIGQYIREDGSTSYFADMIEAWWWCLQTLTSEGYGVPWAPVTEGGKVVSVIAALSGTIILALPIAVVGVTFDDEWVKQAKINKFAAESCVTEYNQTTRNGTKAVPNLLTSKARPTPFDRIRHACSFRSSGAASAAVAPDPTTPKQQQPLQQAVDATAVVAVETELSASCGAPSSSLPPRRLTFPSETGGGAGVVVARAVAVAGAPATVAVQQLARELARDETRARLISANSSVWRQAGSFKESERRGSVKEAEPRDALAPELGASSVEIAEALSSRGTLFSAGSHQANQAYNVQADLHTLLDTHFNAISTRTRTILNEQREKLCRSLNTDLKAALRENALSSKTIDAFRDRLMKRRDKETGGAASDAAGVAASNALRDKLKGRRSKLSSLSQGGGLGAVISPRGSPPRGSPRGSPRAVLRRSPAAAPAAGGVEVTWADSVAEISSGCGSADPDEPGPAEPSLPAAGVHVAG